MAEYGQTLTATVNAEVQDDQLITYRWYRGETEITGASGTQYTLDTEDVGQVIRVEATQAFNSGAAEITKESETGPVSKAKAEAPEALKAETTEVTLKVTEPANGEDQKYEYRIGSGSWQENPLFEGLTPDTEYLVYARVKATSTHSESEPVSGIYRTKQTIAAVYEVYQDTEGQWSEPAASAGEAVMSYTAPVKEGFTVTGYSTAYQANETDRTGISAGERITLSPGTKKLYIYYSRNQYKLTFKADNTTLSEKDMYYGAVIEVPEAPVKTGWSFAGWGKQVPETMPAAPDAS